VAFGRPKRSISHSNSCKEACKSYMRQEHAHPRVPLPEGTRLPNRPTDPGGFSVPVTSDHQGRSPTAEEGDIPQALGGRRRWRSDDETIGYQPIVVGTEITDRGGRVIRPGFPASRMTDHMVFRSRGSSQSRIPSPTRIMTKTVMVSATAGRVINHGTFRIYGHASPESRPRWGLVRRSHFQGREGSLFRAASLLMKAHCTASSEIQC
jgi:hypothetical protein